LLTLPAVRTMNLVFATLASGFGSSPTLRVSNRKIFLFLLLVLGAVAARGQLFTYSFSDVVSGSSATSAGGSAGNVVFSNFSASGVGAASNAGGVFSFTTWTTGATNGSNTFTGGRDATDYFQFTVTPSAGFNLTLASLTFSAGRTSTGARQFSIRSSLDGFATNLTASVTDANMSVVGSNVFQFSDNATTSIFGGDKITLGGTAFTNVSAPITFRIYAYNAESGAGAFRIDDFSINGSASLSAVPEPASTAAAIGGVALLAAWRRRRHRNLDLAVTEK
jgi:MYXO-CTERM domain-containing protein